MLPNEQRFRIVQPPSTHFVPANCEEVECDHYLNGWMTIATVGSRAEVLVRADKHRSWTEQRAPNQSDVIEFIFPPGQQCYRQHQVASGRPALLFHETPGHRIRHTRGEDFMEHLHEQVSENIGLTEG